MQRIKLTSKQIRIGRLESRPLVELNLIATSRFSLGQAPDAIHRSRPSRSDWPEGQNVCQGESDAAEGAGGGDQRSWPSTSLFQRGGQTLARPVVHLRSTFSQPCLLCLPHQKHLHS